MDFKVTATIDGVKQEEQIFLQAHEALNWVSENFGQWNNFHPDKQLCIMFNKTISDADTLGIATGDDLSLSEMLS